MHTPSAQFGADAPSAGATVAPKLGEATKSAPATPMIRGAWRDTFANSLPLADEGTEDINALIRHAAHDAESAADFLRGWPEERAVNA